VEINGDIVSGEKIATATHNEGVKEDVARKKKKIERTTYAEGWELEPDDEERLEGKVPRDIVEDDTEGEGFEEVEEAKDYPVGEPLYVIVRRWRFDGLEREVSGQTPTHEV
jgi:hypothetical protein